MHLTYTDIDSQKFKQILISDLKIGLRPKIFKLHERTKNFQKYLRFCRISGKKFKKQCRHELNDQEKVGH